MSTLKHFAMRADELAKAAFAEYSEAEQKYKNAEKKLREARAATTYGRTPQAMAKIARADADLKEAEAEYQTAKRTFESHINDFKALRDELAAAIEIEYSVDPAALDANILELMKSGVMNSGEYRRLYKDAQSKGNHTMTRLLGRYAEDAAAVRGEKYGQNDSEARALRSVAYEARKETGKEKLDIFDAMTDTYRRCVRTPSLINKWDDIVAPAISEF